MVKDIISINVLGANFDSMTSFDLFNPNESGKVKTVKGTLLYGRNGTGKSTIARAFRKLAGGNVPVITSATLFNDLGDPVTLSEDERKHIFIFDEDYVDKNVRFKEDHLETIVMLGQAADLSEKIEMAEAEQCKAKFDYDNQDKVFKEYCDEKNVSSPKYYLNLLVNALRGDDNWAGRDRKISNSRQNTGVNEDTYKKFVNRTPIKPKTELISDFNTKLQELKAARTGAFNVEVRVPEIPESYSTFDDETIQFILAERIEKPELSEREQKLIQFLEDGQIRELSDRLLVFRKKEILECPYCFQKVTKEYKETLVESLEKVLSKAIENHQKTLRMNLTEPILIDLKSFEKIEGYENCIDLVAKINTEIEINNINIHKKLEKTYVPINAKITEVKTLVTKLQTALADLEKARLEYNKDAKKTGPISNELSDINNDIAYYDIVNIAKQLDGQKLKYDYEYKKLKKLEDVYYKSRKIVDELEAQRKNMKIAIDAINACFKYIFFSEDRLKIIYVNGMYKLLSHGKNVKPCEVSVGERNIIGLCYYFTSILEGKEEKLAYDDEYLLVIDDPISSYDTENRIGILSFLKYKLSVFLEGNPNTKALVMTHDLMTFYDIHKLFEEIVERCKKKGYSQGPKFNRFELCDKGLKAFSYHNRQEYSEILKATYTYASGQQNEYELIIGNLMRQALEAFSTFEYKKGIEAVSTDEQILCLLPKPEFASYYRNLMYRLVLHGGSHKEEQIKAMKDFQFFSLISDSEKKRTAKDVLCFIYLLNKRHLLEHLKDLGNIEAELNSWCQDIKSRAAVI